jgi:hypothetical protein
LLFDDDDRPFPFDDERLLERVERERAIWISSPPAYTQGFERALPAAARSNARSYAVEGVARTW